VLRGDNTDPPAVNHAKLKVPAARRQHVVLDALERLKHRF